MLKQICLSESMLIYACVFREAVLCTLQIECQGRTEALQCLDAISGTGRFSSNTLVRAHPAISHCSNLLMLLKM